MQALEFLHDSDEELLVAGAAVQDFVGEEERIVPFLVVEVREFFVFLFEDVVFAGQFFFCELEVLVFLGECAALGFLVLQFTV